jgi:hypothetical protein
MDAVVLGEGGMRRALDPDYSAFGRDRRYPITNGFTNLMWEIEGK